MRVVEPVRCRPVTAFGDDETVSVHVSRTRRFVGDVVFGFGP